MRAQCIIDLAVYVKHINKIVLYENYISMSAGIAVVGLCTDFVL